MTSDALSVGIADATSAAGGLKVQGGPTLRADYVNTGRLFITIVLRVMILGRGDGILDTGADWCDPAMSRLWRNEASGLRRVFFILVGESFDRAPQFAQLA